MPSLNFMRSASCVGEPVTVTTLNVGLGASYLDPYLVVTLTNGIQLTSCRPADVKIDIPPGKKLTVS